jgi:hypothetical protein
MRSAHWIVALGVVAITALSFLVYPGWTYLQSDTQIYVPILERLYNPTLLAKDLVATEPHVSFTVFDEVSVGVRKLTGLGFREILIGQQALARAAGILGVFLIASALGLARGMALMVAAIFALGTWIYGPTVMSVEVEAVPRGLALPLVLLGVGLAAAGRDLAAGIAVGIAFLYQPPAVYPFWIVYFALTLWPGKPAVMQRRIMGLLPLLAAVLLLFILSRCQIGETEKQELLSRIDVAQEKLQRFRAPYNWISIWGGGLAWHYLATWLLGLLACWRLRRSASQDLNFFLVGLPVIGLASVPLSYLLLEKWKLAVIPQFQPMRALLFATVVLLIAACAAGLKAASEKRPAEALAWLFVAFLVPMQLRFDQIWTMPWQGATANRLALAFALAAVAALVAWLAARSPRWSMVFVTCAILLPFPLIPAVARLPKAASVETPELRQLADWARNSTPGDAVFLFPDAGRGLEPGIFRAHALRALYVDWKSGGQVNYLRKFSEEWWRRWQRNASVKPGAQAISRYANWGVDFIVLRAENSIPGRTAVYANRRFLVYRILP